MSTNTIVPMAVSGVRHLVERAYRESGELQYLRELVVNALEAGAFRIELGPEWSAVESDGVYRLMIADNGKGMDAEELLKCKPSRCPVLTGGARAGRVGGCTTTNLLFCDESWRRRSGDRGRSTATS